ncbi:hypothetical protein [Grimontia sp. NTOU-MAR1]|uniref:hypothetical protein n=1 Tax=Grimontia sp. NTOU-MAR1 TaxID=3111011 RepID=UPI002DB5EEA3|nr:hypothetical protein [Grimontia sp. NTOU-MAR1]WRW01004.1 hypothetical protein VP504_21410 [Grimontia sp. NTOU-MAR1]
MPIFTRFAMIIVFTALSAFSLNAAQLRHNQLLSRDHYYISLNSNDPSFQQRNIVGGEHNNRYFILGLENDVLSVSLTSLNGIAGFSVHGEGIERYHVIAMHTWLEVSVSAHPFAEYLLEVTLHDGE